MRKLGTLAAPIARLYPPQTLHPLLTPQRGERSPACLFPLYGAHRHVRRGAIATLCVSSLTAWLLLLGMAGGKIAAASHTSTDPATVGELGPLIPFHKDAIHAALLWTKDTSPKICFGCDPQNIAAATSSTRPSLIPAIQARYLPP
jgi:hypothetical protein